MIFVNNLFPTKPETSDIEPVLPDVAFVVQDVPPAGSRTYTGDQMGLTSTYNSEVTGTETIAVTLGENEAFHGLGTLNVVSISAFAEVTYSGSDYYCPTKDNASASETLHAQFLEYVDMSTGILVSWQLSMQYQLVSSDCPAINEDLTWESNVVLASLTIGAEPTTLNVYPTQSNFTSFQLNYGGYELTSPIHVEAIQDSNYPGFLIVSFREHGTKEFFQNSTDISPSSSDQSLIDVNVTIVCSTGGCVDNGVSSLPMNYNLVIVASSGDYSQNATVPLQLLKAKWLVMLYSEQDTTPILESTMLYNIQEMINVSKDVGSPKVGMLVLLDLLYDAPGSYQAGNYADSTSRPTQDVWGISTIPSGTTQLYQVVNGNFQKKRAIGGFRLLEQSGHASQVSRNFDDHDTGGSQPIDTL